MLDCGRVPRPHARQLLSAIQLQHGVGVAGDDLRVRVGDCSAASRLSKLYLHDLPFVTLSATTPITAPSCHLPCGPTIRRSPDAFSVTYRIASRTRRRYLWAVSLEPAGSYPTWCLELSSLALHYHTRAYPTSQPGSWTGRATPTALHRAMLPAPPPCAWPTTHPPLQQPTNILEAAHTPHPTVGRHGLFSPLTYTSTLDSSSTALCWADSAAPHAHYRARAANTSMLRVVSRGAPNARGTASSLFGRIPNMSDQHCAYYHYNHLA